MKRLLMRLAVLVLASMLASPARADVGIEWDAAFGGADADQAYDVQPTSDSGYVAAGFGGQGYRLVNYVVKTDGLGQLQWQQTLSLNNYGGRAYSVIETRDGGYVLRKVGLRGRNTADEGRLRAGSGGFQPPGRIAMHT